VSLGLELELVVVTGTGTSGGGWVKFVDLREEFFVPLDDSNSL
jgi:hypothetical protein